MEVLDSGRAWNHVLTQPELFLDTIRMIHKNIHPFVDGNGRTERMFLKFNLISKYEQEELLKLRSWIEQDMINEPWMEL